MNNAMIIDPSDDVAIAIEAIGKGEAIVCQLHSTAGLTALEDIPIYHKVAVRDIAQGGKVRKYGEHIGEALCPILRGSHLHVHNVDGVRENLDEK